MNALDRPYRKKSDVLSSLRRDGALWFIVRLLHLLHCTSLTDTICRPYFVSAKRYVYIAMANVTRHMSFSSAPAELHHFSHETSKFSCMLVNGPCSHRIPSQAPQKLLILLYVASLFPPNISPHVFCTSFIWAFISITLTRLILRVEKLKKASHRVRVWNPLSGTFDRGRWSNPSSL